MNREKDQPRSQSLDHCQMACSLYWSLDHQWISNAT